MKKRSKRIDPYEIFKRDHWTCALCGNQHLDGSLVPHHRANRGMGGNPAADVPANLLSLCSRCNTIIEATPGMQRRARRTGVKIHNSLAGSAHLVPVHVPVNGDTHNRVWMVLDNHYGMTIADSSYQEQIDRMGDF